MDRISLDTIDTKVAADNVAKKIQENKTYFLNGKWGSGKTEFLKRIAECINKKFAELDIWNTKDDRSLLEIAFQKLYPIAYYFVKFSIVIAVVLSVIASPAINLGLGSLFGIVTVKLVAIVALVVTVWNLLKIKSDWIYYKLLEKLPTNKILVIDDFDRATEEKQIEAYKLFNLLRGKLPIIFVGEYSKLACNKDGFLEKIIDNRIELPFVLHSSQIWESYFKTLSTKFNDEISNDLKKVFTIEGRNLRDREHFNNYVNQEFFERGKFGHVQVTQQLTIIYIYLYHYEWYLQLLDGLEIEISSEYRKFLQEDRIYIEEYENRGINDILHDLLQNNDNYPQAFPKNKQGYYLYEIPSNMSVEEGNTVIEDEKDLETYFTFEKSVDNDFYLYFIANYSNFTIERKERLFDMALKYAKENYTTPIINYIIREKDNEIRSIKRTSLLDSESFREKERDPEKVRFNAWRKILNKYSFDKSEIISLLNRNYIFNFLDLKQLMGPLELNMEVVREMRRADLYLMLYLIQKNIFDKYKEWDTDIWNIVNDLRDREFLLFWLTQGIISNRKRLDNILDITTDEEYIVWTKKYKFTSPSEEIDGLDNVIKNIEGKIRKLERSGYKFIWKEEKMRDEYYID